MLLTPPWAFSSAGLANGKEQTTKMRKPNAATIMPMPILRGEDGSLPFFAKAPNTAIETGVKATTKNGLNCWNCCGRMLMGSGIT